MKSGVLLLSLGLVFAAAGAAHASLLLNGNLDETYQQEIVPGFFLPKPASWMNVGTRANTGPYEDEMSSESWAGPAPTPATANDMGVFFKPFSGNANDGAATGHLFQDVAGNAGWRYTLTGWAGAEPNFLATDAVIALEFLDGSGAVIGGVVQSLMGQLFVDNGQPFDYKQYTVAGVAPVGTATVRSRVSMIGGLGNPAGGGQAFVVDDFELNGVVPEPATMTALALGAAAMLRRRRK